jgi:hypothetical protein
MSVREKVKAALKATFDDCQDFQTAQDVLRVFQKEATLQLETLKLRNLLTTDPFERFQQKYQQLPAGATNIAAFIEAVEVTDYHRVITKEGYAYIQAVVQIGNAAADAPSSSATSIVELIFRYERRCHEASATLASPRGSSNSSHTVWYSIDLSKDHQAAERMLWVQVWPVGSVPSPNKAKNIISDGDDDLWSDIENEDDDDEQYLDEQYLNEKQAKKARSDAVVGQHDNHYEEQQQELFVGRPNPITEQENQQDCDRFVAGIDPKVLRQFLIWSKLLFPAADSNIDNLSAFFLLMTFPYYEQEWDLVGYVLDAVFDFNDDDDDG